MSSKADFESATADLRKQLPLLAQHSVMMLVMAWPMYEEALSRWIVAELDAPPDKAAIVIGNMDPRNKLSKLKELQVGRDNPNTARVLASLSRTTASASKTRNVVIHNPYIGPHWEDGDLWLKYSTPKFVPGSKSHRKCVILNYRTIQFTADFAFSAAEVINNMLDRAE